MATPPFVGSDNSQQQMQAILQQILQQSQQKNGQQSAPALGAPGQAKIGIPGITPPPPQVAVGQTSNVGQGVGPALGQAGQRTNSNGVPGIGQTMPGQIGPSKPVLTPGSDLPNSFDSPGAKKGAIAQQMTNQLISVVNQKKQEKFEQEKTQTEYLVKTYFMLASQNPPDAKAIDALLSDPKNQKLLHKAGLDLYKLQTEQQKQQQDAGKQGKQKEKSPELSGMQSAIGELADKQANGGQQGQPGQQSQGPAGQPPQNGSQPQGQPAQNGNVQQQSIIDRIKAKMGMGQKPQQQDMLGQDRTLTLQQPQQLLTDDQLKTAAEIQAGLRLSAKEDEGFKQNLRVMSQEDQKLSLEGAKILTAYDSDMKKIASEEKIASGRTTSAEKIASADNKLRKEQMDMVKDNYKAMNDLRKKIADGKISKDAEGNAKDFEKIAQSYEALAKTKDIDKDLQTHYLEQAEKVRKQAEALKQNGNMMLLNDLANQTFTPPQ